MIEGEMGRRRIVVEVVTARGKVNCMVVKRQGAVPTRLFGEAVRVMA